MTATSSRASSSTSQSRRARGGLPVRTTLSVFPPT